MNTRSIARRAALAGATLTAAMALSACDGDRSPSGMPDTPGTTSPSASASGDASRAAFGAADLVFAQLMIPHHQQAVKMAELAESRAVDPEVKRLATEIKVAQAREIATMSGWLAAWARPLPSPGAAAPHADHGMSGMLPAADMAKLAAVTGRDFERQFLSMMIAHHEGAVSIAQAELSDGENAQAKDLAQQMITGQQAEIDMMKKILDRL